MSLIFSSSSDLLKLSAHVCSCLFLHVVPYSGGTVESLIVAKTSSYSLLLRRLRELPKQLVLSRPALALDCWPCWLRDLCTLYICFRKNFEYSNGFDVPHVTLSCRLRLLSTLLNITKPTLRRCRFRQGLEKSSWFEKLLAQTPFDPTGVYTKGSRVNDQCRRP